MILNQKGEKFIIEHLFLWSKMKIRVDFRRSKCLKMCFLSGFDDFCSIHARFALHASFFLDFCCQMNILALWTFFKFPNSFGKLRKFWRRKISIRKFKRRRKEKWIMKRQLLQILTWKIFWTPGQQTQILLTSLSTISSESMPEKKYIEKIFWKNNSYSQIDQIYILTGSQPFVNFICHL